MIITRIPVVIILMMGSVGLYLCLRAMKQFNVSAWVQNLIMFLPATIIFGIIAYFSGINLRVDRSTLGYIVPISILFSWLANRTSLISLQRAPNPGYSLMISKSYVIITAIVSVPLFQATLSGTDILSILLIIGFSSLILIGPKNINTPKQSSGNWIGPALYSFFGWAGLALSSSWLIRKGLNPLIVNFWMFLVTSSMIIGEGVISGQKLTLPRSAWGLAGGVALSMVIFNWAIQLGYKLAPNPGYVNAANASSIALLTMCSYRIFKDEFSIRKMIGIIGVVVGIGILFIF